MVFTAYECDGIWVQRRGAKVLYPNKTPFECMLDEAFKEASFSKELVKKYARSTGVVTHSQAAQRTTIFLRNVLLQHAAPREKYPACPVPK